jgi:hypothetical protein
MYMIEMEVLAVMGVSLVTTAIIVGGVFLLLNGAYELKSRPLRGYLRFFIGGGIVAAVLGGLFTLCSTLLTTIAGIGIMAVVTYGATYIFFAEK